jgi:hypothetical protein
MNKKTALIGLACWMLFSPTTSLYSFHGGEGHPAQFNDRHYVDPNSYWYGVNNGYYGGVIDDAGVVIDPSAGSGAGMTDDSDQLYQSYLEHFGVSG